MEETVISRWNLAPMAAWKAVQRFNMQGGWVMSSHVAMSILLSLFPFILFVVALAGALSRDLPTDALIEAFFGVWPDDIADPLTNEIRKVLNSDHVRLITVGGVLALYFASNGVDAIRIALSHAYRDHDPRPFWKTRGLSLAFVVAGGAVVLAGLTVGIGVPAYFKYFENYVPAWLNEWQDSALFNSGVAVGALTLAVSACHVWMPGLKHSFRDIWPGVAVTIGLWIAAAWGFSVYVATFADYSATYAGLAGAMAALIFLYLMAAIMILGAEFNGALIRARSELERSEAESQG